MPLFFQQNINQRTTLGIWSIEEEESFFLESALLHREITHPQKRKQHLAGRYILKILNPEFPLQDIQIAETRKPFLPYDPFHFSISHSGNYAAAIVSATNRVGVDVEMYTPRVLRILHKFLKEEEIGLLNEYKTDPYIIETVLWSVKESVYKWHGVGEVDFREHMNIKNIEKTSIDQYSIFIQMNDMLLEAKAICFSDFCLTSIVS